jgi:hypothetical protein
MGSGQGLKWAVEPKEKKKVRQLLTGFNSNDYTRH